MGNTKNQKKIFLIASLIVISLVVVLIINIPFAFEKDPLVLPSDDDVTIQKTIPPSVEITALKKDTKTSSFVVKGVSVNDVDKPIQVKVKLDEGPYKIATPIAEDDWSEWSISFDTSSIQDGAHLTTARILDYEGDEIIVSSNFSYNLNPIVITNPKYNDIVTGETISISGTTDIKDGNGMPTVEAKLGDGPYKIATPIAEDDWSEWSISFDTSSIQDGTYFITAQVIDADGNVEQDAIPINYLRGSILITTPRFEYIETGETISISGITDIKDGNGKPIVLVKLDEDPYKIATPIAEDDWSEWSISFDASSIQDGTHLTTARILDGDGDIGWYSRDFTYLSNTLPIEIHDDFSKELYSMNLGGLSPNKNLFAIWHDNGTLGVIADHANDKNNVFLVQSGVVTEKNKTKSALVLSSHEYKNFKLSLDVRTDQQLRKNDPPNAWEVGWVIWTYQNPTHFNYFLLKSVGAEYGKYDGGVNPTNQKKLFTSSSPTTSIGEWSHWEIIVKDTHVTIFVNDDLVFEFDDFASFDTGRIGFYLEDASVSFDNLSIIPL